MTITSLEKPDIQQNLKGQRVTHYRMLVEK